MKKNVLIIGAIILALLFVWGTVRLISNQSQSVQVGSFDVNDYSDYIERFPSEEILGATMDGKTAKEKAEALLLEIYGKSVKSKRPYGVSFDEKNRVWLVQGSLPKNRDGGVPHILIRESDGRVLAVWHDK